MSIKCIKCKQNKPRSGVYFNKTGIAGYSRKCKKCYSDDKRSVFIKTLKIRKVRNSIKRQCKRCKNLQFLHEYRHGASICNTCFILNNKNTVKLDRFCGICSSTDGLKYIAGSLYAPHTLCMEHYSMYKVVKLRLRKYKLKLIDYLDMYNAQSGKCSICNSDTSDMFIDHCHISNNVRALVCRDCNTNLGFLDRMIKNNVLIQSLDYIQKHADKDLQSLNK